MAALPSMEQRRSQAGLSPSQRLAAESTAEPSEQGSERAPHGQSFASAVQSDNLFLILPVNLAKEN